jgi:DNA-binding response OmpR family regulator
MEPLFEKKNTAGKRVLIAEDNEELLSLVTAVLEEEGLEVVTARNGFQALAVLSDEIFDVAIVDVVMPDISGLTVLKKLKRDNSEMPVLVMSGHVGFLDEKRFLEMGASRVFKKPFSLDAFAKAVLAAAKKNESEVLQTYS